MDAQVMEGVFHSPDELEACMYEVLYETKDEEDKCEL